MASCRLLSCARRRVQPKMDFALWYRAYTTQPIERDCNPGLLDQGALEMMRIREMTGDATYSPHCAQGHFALKAVIQVWG